MPGCQPCRLHRLHRPPLTLRQSVSHSFHVQLLLAASVYVVLVSSPSSSPSAVILASTNTAVLCDGRSWSSRPGSRPTSDVTLTLTCTRCGGHGVV
jgi:hypothetical protein